MYQCSVRRITANSLKCGVNVLMYLIFGVSHRKDVTEKSVCTSVYNKNKQQSTFKMNKNHVNECV